MNIFLRPCGCGDIETLRKISYDTYLDTFHSFTSDEIMRQYLDDAFHIKKLQAELDHSESKFFFLYADGKLAGYIKINYDSAQTDIHDPQSLELERIYFVKEFQGKGLGKILIEKAAEIAEQENKSSIWLGVWEKNAKAISFYQKNGFYIAGSHSFFMGSEEQNDYIMRKDLIY